MSRRFASGKRAEAICDVCGFQYRLRDLKEVVEKGNRTGIMACYECWDKDHPQNKLGEFPVDDPQAIRNPRPDTAELATSRALRLPVPGAYNLTAVGIVTVTTT